MDAKQKNPRHAPNEHQHGPTAQPNYWKKSGRIRTTEHSDSEMLVQAALGTNRPKGQVQSSSSAWMDLFQRLVSVRACVWYDSEDGLSGQSVAWLEERSYTVLYRCVPWNEKLVGPWVHRKRNCPWGLASHRLACISTFLEDVWPHVFANHNCLWKTFRIRRYTQKAWRPNLVHAWRLPRNCWIRRRWFSFCLSDQKVIVILPWLPSSWYAHHRSWTTCWNNMRQIYLAVKGNRFWVAK